MFSPLDYHSRDDADLPETPIPPPPFLGEEESSIISSRRQVTTNLGFFSRGNAGEILLPSPFFPDHRRRRDSLFPLTSTHLPPSRGRRLPPLAWAWAWRYKQNFLNLIFFLSPPPVFPALLVVELKKN